MKPNNPHPSSLITDHLDTWSSAIKAKSSAGRGGGKKREFYGIKKLRELILELAVRGLLVPQDSEDESATECLKKSNSGILQFKKTPDQSAPSGWLSLPLGCIIASNIGGGTPSKGNPSYWDGDIPWASVKDIQSEKFIDTAIDSITATGLKNSSSNLIPPNRLLIVTRMGLGKLAINKCAMAINQDLRAIEPISALDLDYGYLLFKALNLVGTGMTVKGVKVKELHAIQVLLPPLAEQHRIVAKVDELMALCDQLEQQQEDSARTHGNLVGTLLGALTAASERGQFEEAWQRIEANFDTLFTTESSIDQLKQTILQLAVMGKLVEQDLGDEPAAKLLKRIAGEKLKLIKEGKIKKQEPLAEIGDEEIAYDSPEGWTWSRMGDLALYQKGYAFKSAGYLHEGLMITKIKNLTENHIQNSAYIAPERASELSQYIINKDDIVMTTVGSWFSAPISAVGRSFLVNEIFDNSLLNQNAVRIRSWRDVSSMYLHICINSPAFKKYLIQEAQGTANQASITQQSIKNFLICVPPNEEQHRIVAKVDELMALCDRLKASLQSTQSTQLHLADTLVEAAIN